MQYFNKYMVAFKANKYIKDTIDAKVNVDNIDTKGKDYNNIFSEKKTLSLTRRFKPTGCYV